MPSGATARAHIRVIGRVQGVGFRWAVAREAERLNLSGWVRNLASGQVEAVVEGAPDSLHAFVAWCRSGPPGAYVRDIALVEDEPLESLTGFVIAQTANG